MKHSGHTRSGVLSGFRMLFLSTVLAYIPQAMGSSSNGIPTATPPSINFGIVPVGGSQTQSMTVTNPGGPKITIFNATLNGTGFSLNNLKYPVTLSGGQSVQCTLTFAPQVSGNASGSLYISFYSGGKGYSGPSGTLNVPLSGTGGSPGQLTPNPNNLNFGNVRVGSSQTLSETVSNSGGQTINISQASASGPGFSITGLTPPLSLAQGQSVTFSASFSPTSAGSASGNISINSDAGTLTIPLAGNGTSAGLLSVAPTSYNFGNVVVGTSASTKASLNASGATVTVNSVSFSNPEFVISGISFPVAIPAGQGAAFTVTFTPQTSGTVSANASFASDAANSPTVLSLSGSGTAPQQHSVGLSWVPSPSPNIVGYNVYRSGTSGGPYTQINSGLDSGTAFTDSSVAAGQTYYYVTTAVDSSNLESGYSNQTTAVIPSP